VEHLIFRTAQEALRNVAGHADAEHVQLQVGQRAGQATLRVTDDGRGFDKAALVERRAEGHMGLAMLEDLARTAGGDLHVDSEPGRGTTVSLEVPSA
jgi:two-component system, NarL family, sensor kinase